MDVWLRRWLPHLRSTGTPLSISLVKSIVGYLKARRKTLGSAGVVTGSQVICVALGLIGGLIQARYVTPDVLGSFGAFTILAGYLAFLHLGSLTALNREYPYWLGKGDPARALHAARVTQGWTLFIGCFVTALYAGLTAWSLGRGNWAAAAGWASQLLVGASFYSLYLGSTYRSNDEFVVWARIATIGAILTFLALPLVVWLGYWGLCLRAAVPGAITLLIQHHFRPVKVRPLLRIREVGIQAKFGLPMDIGGFLATACTVSLMSTFVLWGYGTKVLGLLMLAKYAETAIQQIVMSVIQMVVVRIHHRMGATEDLRHCVKFALKPMYLGLLLLLPGLVLVIVVAAPGVQAIAPAYVEAVPLFRVMVVAVLFSVLQLPCHVLVAAKQVYWVATSSVSCFVVFSVLSILALAFGWSVTAIAVAYVAGKGAAAILSWFFLLRAMRQSRSMCTMVSDTRA